MDFWERLDWLLKERNLSRKQLCEVVGISSSSVSVWKSRKAYPDADIAVAIARALGVTVEYLLDGPLGEGQEPIRMDIQKLTKVYTISNENQELQSIVERLITCEPAQIHRVRDVIDAVLR